MLSSISVSVRGRHSVVTSRRSVVLVLVCDVMARGVDGVICAVRWLAVAKACLPVVGCSDQPATCIVEPLHWCTGVV